MGNKKFRDIMTRFFKNINFNLVFRPQERTFEIQKQIGGTIFSYPYILTSDTLQTIIFHVIAMESNKNSTLVFELRFRVMWAMFSRNEPMKHDLWRFVVAYIWATN